MNIGITGAYGFLGWHMRCYLHSRGVRDIRLAGRDEFASSSALESFVDGCDAIFHFAGVNRAKDEGEIADTNPSLANQLVNALRATNSEAHVIYSSSTHADGSSVYGISKQQAGRVLADWAAGSDGKASLIVFPHLYGECGRPFYNSVVHTFCHQLAVGEELTVRGGAELQLLHAQDAAELAWNAFEQKQTGIARPGGRTITVNELACALTSMHDSYSSGVIPDLRDEQDRRLFNTLRSFLFPKMYPVYLRRREDPRGWLFEAIRELNGGQVFLSSTRPGVTRGNHYHRFKVERFCVLSGEAVIRIRRLFSDEVHEFPVSGGRPCFIDMPPLHTHSISNEGEDEVLTMFWTNEFFDPAQPDTYPEPVQSEQE